MDFANNSSPFKRKNKKKRKSFPRRLEDSAKRFCNHRNENRLTDDDHRYYMDILEHMRKEAKEEERSMMLNNVLQQILAKPEEDIRKLASNQLVSRVMEGALLEGSPESVLPFFSILCEDIRGLSLNAYASHVMEALLCWSIQYVKKQKADVEDDEENAENEENSVQEKVEEEKKQNVIDVKDRKKLIASVKKIGLFICNNLDEFVRDSFGTHVFRSLVETLSGVKVKKSIKVGNKSQKDVNSKYDVEEVFKVPMVLREILCDITDRFINLPAISELITYSYSSAAMQSLLVVLKNSTKKCNKKYEIFANHIIVNGFPTLPRSICDHYNSEEKLPIVFQSTAAVCLVEVLISCATPSQISVLYTKFFEGHVGSLAKHRIGHFALEKLILHWQDKDSFHELFKEVQGAIPAAMEAKHTGILLSLTTACRSLEKLQGQCWKAVMEVLECYEQQERQTCAAQCLVWFLTYDEYQEKQKAGTLERTSMIGSKILQEILHFQRTMKIVDSMLNMSLGELELIVCDPKASHTMDAFTSSKFIKFEKKEKLIRKLKGRYVTLACCTHGSRSLERFWSISSVELKTQICEELSNEELKLKQSKHGTIIYSKFMVRFFKMKNKQDWQELVDTETKKKRLLNELLEDVNSEAPKKKKKKKGKKEP